jgi:hypothetical protein
VNSIIALQTGLPWGPIDGFVNGNDVNLTGEYADRCNFFDKPGNFAASQNGPVPYFSSRTPGPIDDPATFAISNPACAAHASPTALSSYGCYVKGGSVMTPPEPGTFGTMSAICSADLAIATGIFFGQDVANSRAFRRAVPRGILEHS